MKFLKTQIIFACVFVLCFLFAQDALGATIYANYSTGNDTTGDGSSGNPYKTFHKAYTTAVAEDTINLTGTFTWTNSDETGDASSTGYTIGKNLTIQGQTAGTTIIQSASSYASGDRSVFTISAGVTAVINDVTVRYGYNTGGSNGGGINNNGTLTVNRCNVSYNYVNQSGSGYGGGIRNAGTLTVNDSTINNNYAYSQGGGIVNAYVAAGTNVSYITNSTITANSISATVATVGGSGMYLRSGTAYVTNCTFAYNIAPSGTGASALEAISGTTLYIKNTIVAGNKVTVSGTSYNVNYASGNFFDIVGGGTINENGANIFGKASGISFSATTWYDVTSNGAGDNVFTLYNTATTGSLYLDGTLQTNNNANGTKTLALALNSSIAVNNGLATANGSVNIPASDQRQVSRSTTDIGAYEFDSSYQAEAPTTQSSSIVFSLVQNDRMTISWTAGDGAVHAVFVKQANSGTAVPVDATTYTANTVFASGTQIGSSGWYCVYSGTGTSVTVTGLANGTDYIAQVFEYNGLYAGVENYLTDTATDNPKAQQTHTPVTIYANYSTGNDTTGDGSSGNPYKTFHKAYTTALGGDTLNLTGTFTWTNADETGDAVTTGYTIAKNLTIQGQSAGATIIQAAASASTANKEVFTISAGYTVVINDVTVRYGYNTSGTAGGGIGNFGTLTVNRCNVSYNHVAQSTSGYGGGIYNGGTLTVNDSTINNNYAYSQGGGIVNAYTADNSNTSYITNSTIAFNSQEANAATVGGAGFYNRSGTSYITNTTIAYNNAIGQSWPWNTGNTSGLDISSGIVYLKNSIVAYNKVNGSYLMTDGSGYDIGTDNVSYFTDNGGNILGTTVGISSYHATSWTDKKSGGTGDGVFTLEGAATTGSLYLDTELSANDGSNGTTTLAITNASSIAVNNYASGANGSVNLPASDQRQAGRSGATDIGSFEYNGTGLSIAQPTTQASSITFSSVSYASMTVSWTSGNGTKRAVFAKQANSGTAVPVDATTYTASATFGSGTQIGSSGWYAVYNGSGTSVSVTGLSLGADYIFQVFEYNGVTSGQEDYLTDSATDNPKSQATVNVTEPTSQATNITFSSVAYTSMTVSWTSGNGAKRAVFAKQANSGSATPVDDVNYTANTVFASGTQIGTSGWYAVYNGSGASVSVTGLTAGTDYIFQVFEYNDYSSTYNYNANSSTDNPKSQTATSVIAPTTQAYNITFSSVAYNQMTVGWTNGNSGTSTRVVFAKQADSGTSAPADNTNYTANSAFGSGTQIGASGWYAVYNGSGTSVTVTGLSPSTSYIFHVVEYNYNGSAYAYNANSATDNSKAQATLAVTEPTTQAYSVTFSSVTNSQFAISWTNGNGAKRAVFVKAGSSGTASPVDATTYTANTAFGSGTQIGSSGWYCVYNNTGTSVTVTGLSSSTTYIAQVFEYNGTAGIENYFTSSAVDNPKTQATTDAPTEGTIGSGTSTTGITEASPVNIWYRSTHGQSVYTAAELSAIGMTANSQITKIGFYIASAPSRALPNFVIRVKHTSDSTVANWQSATGMTTVYSSASYLPTAGGFDSLTLTTPFTWNGTDNIVIDTAFSLVDYSQSGTVRYYSSSNGYRSARSDGADQTNVFSGGSASSSKPQVKITFSVPVTTYTLTYSAGSHGSLTGTTSQTVNSGASGSAVTAVPDTGYVFSSWSDGSTDNPRTDTNVLANVSATANFSTSSDTIYVNSSSGNDTTGDGTISSPYKTFYKGYSMASSGKTLDLTGTFTWTNSAEAGDAVLSGFTISKNLTISGHGADQTILQAASSDNIADRRVLTIASGSTVAINNLAVRYGRVLSTSYDGGGILNNGTTTISSCEIYSNRAPSSYGGGISNWNRLSLENSTVYNNVANYMGGGIVNSYYVSAGGYLNITNSTIAYNQVTARYAYFEGGGVHYRKGGGTITNSTIAFNNACGSAGLGIDDPTGTIVLKNNIIAKNTRMAGCSNGGPSFPMDFEPRQLGYGNVTDNGSNIIGFSYYYTFSGSNDWIGASNWGAAGSWNQNTFTLHGSATTGSLNLDTYLALNGNTNKTQTLQLLANSIAINNGADGVNGAISVPSADQRGSNRSGATDIGAFEYQGAPPDTTPPAISGISANAGDNSAVITWSTDEESTSQVKYDPTTYLTTSTPVDASLSIGHEVTLSNLVACSKYYYSPVSQDDSGNTTAGAAQYFMTTGCVASTTPSAVSELVFTPFSTNGAEVDTSSADPTSSDHSVTQSSGNLTLGVTVPSNFSETPTSLQVKSLTAVNVLASLNKPANYNSVGSSVFDIKALSDPATSVSSLSSSVTVTLSYTANDIAGLDETTLKIYRNENDGNGWRALDNCSVDTTNKIVTCTTDSFSVFGLFGQAQAETPAQVVSGGGSIPVHLAQQMSDRARIEQLKKHIAELQAQLKALLAEKNAKPSSGNNQFARDLFVGISGDDVKQLQEFLNSKGFKVSETGDGSPGNETSFFGQGTKQALIKFQKANNIAPAWGFFGPATRFVVSGQ